MKKPLITKLKMEQEMGEVLTIINNSPSGAQACAEIAMKHMDYTPSILELLAEISEHVRKEKGEKEAQSFNMKYAQPYLTKQNIKKP